MDKPVRSFQFGDWLVEPHLNRISRRGEEHQLEPKTMDVLAYLLGRAGDVVSSQELLDQVWRDRVVEEGAVHHRVSKIRRALGDDAQVPRYVENIAKRGYRTKARVRMSESKTADAGLRDVLDAVTPPFPAYDGDETYVFVCYAHADRAEVYRELEFLRAAGVNIWYDEGISPGSDWTEELAKAIGGCQQFLIFLSQAALASSNCRDEIQFAKGEGKSLLAVHLEPVALTGGLKLSLGATQAVVKHGITQEDYARKLLRVVAGQPAGSIEEPTSAHTGGPTSPPADIAAREEETAVARYLEAMCEEYGFVEIRGMGAERVEQLPLDQVFTPLRVNAGTLRDGAMPRAGERFEQTESGDGDPATSDLWLRDAISEFPHVVLIGDPGSGKTTFLRFTALALARAGLGERGRLSSVGLSGAVEMDRYLRYKLYGEQAKNDKAVSRRPDPDERPAPLPIFVRAVDFGKFLASESDASLPATSPKHFYSFLDWLQHGMAEPLPDGYLSARLNQGGCYLLVDGLDEVAGEALRIQLAEIMLRVIRLGSSVGNRHLISCRIRAWQGRVQMQDQRIEQLRLLDFAEHQVSSFVRGWVEALYRVPAAASLDDERLRRALNYHDELLNAINARPATRSLAANPLMLTVLAVVHWNRKSLPEQRAELYQSAVGYLIRSRETSTALTEYERLEGLQAVALAMFEDPDGVQRRIGRVDAANAMAEKLDIGVADALAVLESEALLSGVLVSRSEGEFEFWHLTFQEFLAACELYQDEERWPRIRDHLSDDRWHEVLLLLAGCIRSRSGKRAAGRLASKILQPLADNPSVEASAASLVLVSKIREDLLTFGGDPTTGTPYADLLLGMLDLFEPGGRPSDEMTRIGLGRAIGQLSDPRLAAHGDERILLPAGQLIIESHALDPAVRHRYTKHLVGKTPKADRHGDWRPKDKDVAKALAQPPQTYRVNDFWLSKYRVTVDAFERFVNAGEVGYLNRDCWTREGWQWREQRESDQPERWQEQLRYPNQPVGYVNYAEAEAYCRWVGGRLPTEAEWEWAAYGGSSRTFPWGDAPSDTTRESASGERVQPIGIYPMGQTPEGVSDLTSYGMEWTGTCFDPFPDGAPEDSAALPFFNWWMARHWARDPVVAKGRTERGPRTILTRNMSGPSIGFRVAWTHGPDGPNADASEEVRV